jgi:hypothetical protein
MIVPNLDLPPADLVSQSLAARLKRLSGEVFAAIDGGLFDDLPAELRVLEVPFRSLFMDCANEEVEKAGPWLVPLTNSEDIKKLVELSVSRSCAVFWSTHEGEQGLWRHLRLLNQVLVPLGSPPTTTRMLFRHWDPAVLAAVLPTLDPPQSLRVLPQGTEVVLYAPDNGGIQSFASPNAEIAPARVPLQFELQQMEQIRQAMVQASRLRTARFLRSSKPDHFQGTTDAFFWGATLASEQSADALGIRSERARARWAYLMMLSDGKAVEQPEVTAFLTAGPQSPDVRVRDLMRHTVDALRAGAAG